MDKVRNIEARDTDLAADGGDIAVGLRPLNARSIALSVLLGSHPPVLSARALVGLAGLFGIAGGTMRTALSRMLAAGDVTADGGRYQLAGPLLDRQIAQDAGRRPPASAWDRRWHTIVAVADQRHAAQRRSFRTTMANHRFGELRPDIWMRPTNLGPPPIESDWIVTTGELDGIDHARLTGRLWDLDSIADRAQRLLDEMVGLRDRVDWQDPCAIPELFTTSAAVVRFLRHEPLLPTDLTPVDWPVDLVRTTYDSFEADHQRLLQRFLRTA